MNIILEKGTIKTLKRKLNKKKKKHSPAPLKKLQELFLKS